jgi:hypothetical protein
MVGPIHSSILSELDYPGQGMCLPRSIPGQVELNGVKVRVHLHNVIHFPCNKL